MMGTTAPCCKIQVHCLSEIPIFGYMFASKFLRADQEHGSHPCAWNNMASCDVFCSARFCLVTVRNPQSLYSCWPSTFPCGVARGQLEAMK